MEETWVGREGSEDLGRLVDYEDRYMRLAGVSPFVTVEQVLAEMSFEPKMAKEIETLETPTEEELAVLRSELDQRGQITDVGKPIIRLDDGTCQFVEEEQAEAKAQETPSSG